MIQFLKFVILDHLVFSDSMRCRASASPCVLSSNRSNFITQYTNFSKGFTGFPKNVQISKGNEKVLPTKFLSNVRQKLSTFDLILFSRNKKNASSTNCRDILPTREFFKNTNSKFFFDTPTFRENPKFFN